MQILYVQIVLRMAPILRAKWDSSGAWKDRHGVRVAFL